MNLEEHVLAAQDKLHGCTWSHVLEAIDQQHLSERECVSMLYIESFVYFGFFADVRAP